MATLALSPANRLGSIQRDIWVPTPESFGWEGKQVHAAIANVLRHRAERSAFGPANETPDDVFTYDSVLPTPVFSVRVKYKYVGQLKPLPYPLDE